MFTPLRPQVAPSLVEPFWNAVHLDKLGGLRKQIQAVIDWSLAPIFPRDSAIVRPTPRCPLCGRVAQRREPRAA